MDEAKKILPIAEQAAAKGVEVPVGKSLKACRELGFDVPPHLEDSCFLEVDDQAVDKPNIDTSLHGRRTGYMWTRPWTPDRFVRSGILPGMTVAQLRDRGIVFDYVVDDGARVVGYIPPLPDDARENWRIAFDTANPVHTKLREMLAADAMVPDSAAALTPEHRHRMLTYLGEVTVHRWANLNHLHDLFTGFGLLCRRYAPDHEFARYGDPQEKAALYEDIVILDNPVKMPETKAVDEIVDTTLH